MEFFRYALAIKTENNKKPNGFYQVFQNPPYVADVFRQKVYAARDLPDQPALLVALPTHTLAEVWKEQGSVLPK